MNINFEDDELVFLEGVLMSFQDQTMQMLQQINTSEEPDVEVLRSCVRYLEINKNLRKKIKGE